MNSAAGSIDPARDWTRGPAKHLAALLLVVAAVIGAGLSLVDGRAAVGRWSVESAAKVADRGGGALDINTATAAELELLPRIGPKLAAAIVADREARGAFKSVDDLDRVPGIGARTVERLRGWVVVRRAEARSHALENQTHRRDVEGAERKD